MKIKFHETLYNLINLPNVQPSHLQATIEKGDNTYDFIVQDTINCEEITVYDDNDEITGVYNGYTKRIAITIMDDVSVELENINIAQQIANLEASLAEQQNSIVNLSQDKLDSSVLGDSEVIGEGAKRSYIKGETFVASGEYYKASVDILKGNTLTEGGNCEKTNINEAIQTIKESEE